MTRWGDNKTYIDVLHIEYTMTIQPHSLLKPNFGYPRSLVTCSTDPAILSTFKGTRKSVIWRRTGLDRRIHSYARELCTTDRNMQRVDALDELLLWITVADNKVVINPAEASKSTKDRMRCMGFDEHPTSLSQFFYEDRAQPLVSDLETNILKNRTAISEEHVKDYWLLFRTTGKSDMPFHLDKTDVLGMNYGTGTVFGSPKGFDYIAGGTVLIEKPNIPLWQTVAGDISILSLPHRSGQCENPDDKRIWAGLYIRREPNRRHAIGM